MFPRRHLLALALLGACAFAHADDFCINPTLPPPGDGEPTGSFSTLLFIGNTTRFDSAPSGPPSTCDKNGCPKGPLCGIAHLGSGSGGDCSVWSCASTAAYLSNSHVWIQPLHSSVAYTLMTWKFDAVPVGYLIPISSVRLTDASGRVSTFRLTLHRIAHNGAGDFELMVGGSAYLGPSGWPSPITEQPVRLWSSSSTVQIDWGSAIDAQHSGLPTLAWTLSGYRYSRQLGAPIQSATSAVGNLGALTVAAPAVDLGFGDLRYSD